MTELSEIHKNFIGASSYAVRTTIQLVKQHGIFTSPNPKPGSSLNSEAAYTPENVYCTDSVSSIIPAKKCYVVVKTENTKVCIQESLVTNNPSEEYAEFKKLHLLISRLGSRNLRLCKLKPGC
jgi:2-hydroxy-3-keto-5-methylthiopentenyl-1-phosphate phosphatase